MKTITKPKPEGKRSHSIFQILISIDWGNSMSAVCLILHAHLKKKKLLQPRPTSIYVTFRWQRVGARSYQGWDITVRMDTGAAYWPPPGRTSVCSYSAIAAVPVGQVENDIPHVVVTATQSKSQPRRHLSKCFTSSQVQPHDNVGFSIKNMSTSILVAVRMTSSHMQAASFSTGWHPWAKQAKSEMVSPGAA